MQFLLFKVAISMMKLANDTLDGRSVVTRVLTFIGAFLMFLLMLILALPAIVENRVFKLEYSYYDEDYDRFMELADCVMEKVRS